MPRERCRPARLRLPTGRSERDYVVEGDSLSAGVVVADAGIGDVGNGEAKARLIGEAPGELELRADLEGAAEVEAAAGVVGPDADAGRDDHPAPEREKR